MPYNDEDYRLASITRQKLCNETAKQSHDLRRWVGHANLLETLLKELYKTNAPGCERNKTSRNASLSERDSHEVVWTPLVSVQEINELETAAGGETDDLTSIVSLVPGSLDHSNRKGVKADIDSTSDSDSDSSSNTDSDTDLD
ncbi:hypothetical protein BP5796_04538 [Coleophoma crateriformis]|uniref:Uncharacterized protein n=1 Tax=Coleophoma crateriformis TaxID=565419 RepID=A0A3D8S9M0_9HELO|nr:hypothetical protein BP5796_04538 [Coleophoma crateriformis]